MHISGSPLATNVCFTYMVITHSLWDIEQLTHDRCRLTVCKCCSCVLVLFRVGDQVPRNRKTSLNKYPQKVTKILSNCTCASSLTADRIRSVLSIARSCQGISYQEGEMMACSTAYTGLLSSISSYTVRLSMIAISGWKVSRNPGTEIDR